MKNILSLAILISLLFISCEKEPVTPDTEDLSTEGIRTKSYQSGTHDGFFWALWRSDGLTGTVNYSNGPAGNYSVSWNMNGNFTCGKGWSAGSRTRRIGYNIGSHSHSGGGGSVGYYGWTRNPLLEYYVNERWGPTRPASGSILRTFSSDGATYDVYTAWRANAPSIDGTQSFRQIFSTRRSQAPIGSNQTITFANHVNAWAAAGHPLGSDISPAAIFVTEAWGQSSGHSNLTIWEAGSGDGGAYNISVRAKGTSGSEQIRLIVGGTTVATWTLTTSMATRTASTTLSGGILVEFFNDASGRDVQVDFIEGPGGRWQAENQSHNTGVWQNGACGGANSEWLHCNGAIGFAAFR